METVIRENVNKVEQMKFERKHQAEVQDARTASNIQSLEAKLDDKTKTLAQLQTALQQANSNLSESTEALDTKAKTVVDLKSRIERQEQSIELLEAKTKQYERERTALMEQNALLGSGKASLSDELNYTTKKLEETSKTILELTEDKRRLAAEKQSLVSEASTNAEAASQTIRRLEEKNKLLDTEALQVCELNKEKRRLEEEIKLLASKDHTGQKNAGILAANKAAALQRQIQQKNGVIEGLKTSLKTAVQKASVEKRAHQTTVETLEKEWRKREADLVLHKSTIQSECQELTKQLSKLKDSTQQMRKEFEDKVAILLTQQEENEEILDQKSKDLTSANGEIVSLRANIESLHSKIRDGSQQEAEAVQSVLILESELKESQDRLAAEEVLVESAKKANAEFANKLAEESSRLEALNLRLRDRQAAADQRAETLKKKTADLDEQKRLIDLQASKAAGAAKLLQSVEKQRADAEVARRASVEAMSATKTELTTRLKEVEEERKRLQVLEMDIDARNKKLMEDQNALLAEKEHLESEKASIKSSFAEVRRSKEKEKKEVLSLRESLTNDMEGVRSQLAGKEEKLRIWERQLEEKLKEMEERDRAFLSQERQAKEELEKATTKLYDSADVLEQEKMALDKEKKNLAKQTNELKQQLKRVESQAVDASAARIEVDQVNIEREHLRREHLELAKRKDALEVERGELEVAYRQKQELLDEKLAHFEQESREQISETLAAEKERLFRDNKKYEALEEDRIYQRAALAKQRVSLDEMRIDMDRRERELSQRERSAEERAKAKASKSLERTMEALKERELHLDDRERELQSWQASMLYQNNNGANPGSDTGEMRRSKEDERQRRLDLMAEISNLQARLMEQNNIASTTPETEDTDTDDYADRKKGLEKWAATLRRQQKNLDDEATSLANDLKRLKIREQRLYQASSVAVDDGNTLSASMLSLNEGLNQSWGALGELEESL
jgi:chromosome segregation ATPase